MKPRDTDLSVPGPTRRKFNRAIVALAAAPLAVPAASEAAEPELPSAAASADAMVTVLRARYGDHIAKEYVSAITANILRNQFAAQRMQKHELANGDEPDFVFSADL